MHHQLQATDGCSSLGKSGLGAISIIDGRKVPQTEDVTNAEASISHFVGTKCWAAMHLCPKASDIKSNLFFKREKARLNVSLLARVLRVCSGSLIGMIRNICDYPAFLPRMPGFKQGRSAWSDSCCRLEQDLWMILRVYPDVPSICTHKSGLKSPTFGGKSTSVQLLFQKFNLIKKKKKKKLKTHNLNSS